MRKENPFGFINIQEAYCGAWIPVSQVTTQEESLPKALKPHVMNVKGESLVPARLVNRIANSK